MKAITFGMALSVRRKWMSPRVEALMVEKWRIAEWEAWTTSIAQRIWSGERGRGAWKEEHGKRSMRWGAEEVEILTTRVVSNIEESSGEFFHDWSRLEPVRWTFTLDLYGKFHRRPNLWR
jgi:hypothetical protein